MNEAQPAGMAVVHKEPQVTNLSFRRIVIAFLVLVAINAPSVVSERKGFSYACGATEAFTSDGVSWETDKEILPTPVGRAMDENNLILRYFSTYSETNPQQNLNCYDKIPSLPHDGPVLLRVTFHYANYDEVDFAPEFQMWIGTTLVADINLKKDDPWIEEVIYPYLTDSSRPALCLVAIKGQGAPLISFIELRPLPEGSYSATGQMLRQRHRIDSGLAGDSALRYPDDVYDRIWQPDDPTLLSTNTGIAVLDDVVDAEDIPEVLPAAVLKTSRNLSRGSNISYKLPVEAALKYHVKVYVPSTISVDAQINGFSSTDPLVSGKTIEVINFLGVPASNSDSIEVILKGKDKSSPEISALEVFQEITPGGSSKDADTMADISSYYDFNLSWIGDPCIPVPWRGLECEDNYVTSLDLSLQNLVLPIRNELFSSLSSLTFLNLSNNRISTEIPDLSGLDKLEVLDLSNNQFRGSLDKLSQLPALTQLFVSNNSRLSGNVPSDLRRRLSVIQYNGTCIDQPDTCQNSFEDPKKSNVGLIAGIIIAVVVCILVVLATVIFFVCRKKRRSKSEVITWRGRGVDYTGNTEIRNWSAAKVFTYKELSTATNHFKKELGEGSFGPVYLGVLSNGQKVAIKMRQDKSQLGADAFANEVFLLSRVKHPNLVALLGYCQEGRNQLLVYEYMPGGTLMDHLYGSRSRLDWVGRLRVAIGAATGISYLHNGSDPKIIHRDVKSNNILLDNNMIAKVSDFGLSKLVTRSEATHVTTLVKGTAGYLDPEYFTTNQLTEKSDVYSFGVVLLEIICGREPLTGTRAPDEYSLIAWAKPYLQAKTYGGIVDRGLKSKFSQESLATVGSLALRCIEKNSVNRPTMLHVLRELEEALLMEEPDRKDYSSQYSATSSTAFDFRSTNSDTPPDSAPQLANVPSFTFPR